MICAACGKSPQQQPCEYCGKSPLLQGNYSIRLDSIVGKGASGVTYSGMELGQSWPVAAKELPLRHGATDKQLELAHREAAVLAQLQHPGIPRYIDSLTAGSGKHRSLWLVTELVHGQTLAAEMESKRYSEDEVLDVVLELLGILQYLHELSPPIVHRDLKPSNVMRKHPGNRIVLIDFGSVRDALKEPGMVGSTVAGTFGYMAPEQFAGDASPASDLYGLGALMVALLSRKEPHKLHDASGNIGWEKAISARPSTRLLLTGLLSREPGDRPGYKHIRKLAKAARKERRSDDAPAEDDEPQPKHTSKAKKGTKPRPRPKPRPGLSAERTPELPAPPKAALPAVPPDPGGALPVVAITAMVLVGGGLFGLAVAAGAFLLLM